MKNSAGVDSVVHLNISDGRSQAQRMLSALEKDYFNVVDMRFHTLLAMVVDYAQAMKFYNLDNREDGVWKPYFSVDETVVIATILATDPNKLISTCKYKFHYTNNNGQRLIQALGSDLTEEIITQISSVYTVAKLLDDWLVLLDSAQSNTGVELRKLIESVIFGLRDELQLLKPLITKSLADQPGTEIFSPGFIKLGFNVDEETKFGHIGEADFSIDKVSIRSSFYSLIKAIEMVQANAAQLLPASLVSKRHDPAVGLLIAFLQLFQRVNNKINRFTHNYIDFYYEQVLGVKARNFVPDSAYLVLKLNVKKADKIRIAKGTEFLAGLDENKCNIIYSADEDFLINDANVCALHTLYFKRDHLSSPENNLKESVKSPLTSEISARQLATGCSLNDIPVRTGSDLSDEDEMQSYPLMGAPKSGEDPDLAKQARIGFALASKVLLLQEGQRTVCITLQFDQTASEDKRTLEQWIKDIAVALEPVNDNDTITSAIEQDTFFKVFRNIFVVSLSTKDGWLEVPEYLPSYSGIDSKLEKNSLTITFSLSADIPPIIPYSKIIHGEDYGTQLPVVKFIINPRGYLYPYGIFGQLIVASARIDVAVEGCRALILHNHIGRLSSLASFTPFGPIPEIGSYLIVGNAEAAGKQLTHFNVVIKWGGLPAGIGGFASYYRNYEAPIDSADIQISTAVLTDNKWLPDNDELMEITDLFELKSGHDAGHEVSNSSTLSCNNVLPYYFSPLECQNLTTEFGYTPSSRRGFFKFTLVAPASAFGHRDYPNALAKVLTFNARQKDLKRHKEVPNPPYTPVITSIAANYKAFSEIVVGSEEKRCPQWMKEKLIYLHPLGWESSVLETDQRPFLLPQYEFSGNLFIGLEAAGMKRIITLYFHLRDNSLPIESGQVKELRWFYLSSNQWLELRKEQIILDSSQGFMVSGIVTLDVPEGITQDNTILPRDLYWLRVSSEHNLENFCSIYSIYAQAIKVTRNLDDNVFTGSSTVLPAGTITRPRKTIPGLGSVIQIQQSFGGVPVERHAYLRARISGRLKHKNRALTSADYEILILEQFPQIYKVKCFANLNHELAPEKRLCPGHILIVALPYQTQEAQSNHMPMLSGHLVNEVKEFITRLAPPFVTINVINPVYEVIQVRCTVKLKNGLYGGFYINRLNQAISDFLSPWNDTIGYTTHFGWYVSKQDLESFIQQIDYIDRVTNFSMLCITPEGDDCFNLFDGAAVLSADSTDSNYKDIVPKYPWSILTPIKQHFIEVDDSYQSINPEITGISELEIGSTFIVSEEKWREKIDKA